MGPLATSSDPGKGVQAPNQESGFTMIGGLLSGCPDRHSVKWG